QGEDATLGAALLEDEVALLAFHAALGHRSAEAEAAGAAGDEGLEEAGAQGLGDAPALVADADAGSADLEVDPAAFAAGLDGVADDVEQGLAREFGVGAGRARSGDVEVDPGAVCLDAGEVHHAAREG